MRGKFFNAIFYLVILLSFSACDFNTTDYIGTVKKIEVSSPDYNSKDMITIEDLVHGFLKANYNEVTKEDIKWEKLGDLNNGQMIKASYKDAYAKIEAIKNGDFIQVRPIEIDFRGRNGERYNFIDLPFKKPSNETTVSTPTSTNTNSHDSVPSNTSSNENYSDNSNTEEFIPNISGSAAYQTETDDKIYDQVRNKFGKVVKDKYVGGSLIDFIKNSNDPLEYEYLRAQFHEILDTMYVTEDKVTYYYLNDIIGQLASKADTDSFAREDLSVEGNKLYYFIGWPKDIGANMHSWIKFEIFERKFKDGLALRTAHVSCAINGVEYKDWEAIKAIYE